MRVQNALKLVIWMKIGRDMPVAVCIHNTKPTNEYLQSLQSIIAFKSILMRV
jgi:hypothetical protein